jgi:hypothetical protein
MQVEETLQMTTATKPKSRTRRVGATSASAKAVSEKVRNLMIDAYMENRAKNAATKGEAAKRKDLLAAMDEEGRLTATITANLPDPTDPMKTISVGLTANVATPESETVDIQKLAKLLSLEDLLKVAKANKGDVEKLFGKALFARCRVVTKGEANVSVSVTK